MAHPKRLIQGSIYMCALPDAKCNCVSVYAGILKGKLLCIPPLPNAARQTCLQQKRQLQQFNTCRDSTSNVYHNSHPVQQAFSKTNAAARVAMYLVRSPEPF